MCTCLLLQNAVLCLIFGLALLAGAIVNTHYASDNFDVYDDINCADYDNDYNDYNSIVKEVCNDIETLFVAEYAAAVSLNIRTCIQWLYYVYSYS